MTAVAVNVFLRVAERPAADGSGSGPALEVVHNYLGEATVAAAYTRPEGNPLSLCWEDCTPEEQGAMHGHVKFEVLGFGTIVRQRNSAWLFVLAKDVVLPLPVAQAATDARLQLVALNTLSVTGLVGEAFDFPIQFEDAFKAGPGGCYYLHRDGSGWDGRAYMVTAGRPVPDFRLEFAARIVGAGLGPRGGIAQPVVLRAPCRKLNSIGEAGPGVKAYVRLGVFCRRDSELSADAGQSGPGRWAWVPSKAFFPATLEQPAATKRLAEDAPHPVPKRPRTRPRLELSQEFIENTTLPDTFAELLCAVE